jgi:arylsulfatase A-like enzyme
MPADPARAASVLADFPWMDELTLTVALDGMQSLGIGAGPQTDVLAVSLSTTDAIGHRYGPDSRELHDQILRLDRSLGVFLDSLYRLRDSSRVVIALTADHGVAPFPEVQTGADRNVGARHVDPLPALRATRAELTAAGVDSMALEFDDGLIYLNRQAFAGSKLGASAALSSFATRLRRTPGVARVDSIASLARRDTVHDAVARRWLHMIPSDSRVEMVVSLTPFSYWGATSAMAEHGSPNDYDAHVPLLLYGPPFRPGKYGELARVVDLAPTLAAVTHTTPTEKLDGHVLRAAIK